MTNTAVADNQEPTLQHIAEQAQAFMQEFQSINLATCNAQGLPEASYATFVKRGNKLYIYVSELAAHCANLQHSGCCSVMFIENEDQAKTVFARRRLVLQCSAEEIARNSADFEEVMGLFKAKFGKFIDMLAPLTDFHLYQLTPSQASYVSGFAKAYYLQGEELGQVQHRNEEGHKNAGPEQTQVLQAQSA